MHSPLRPARDTTRRVASGLFLAASVGLGACAGDPTASTPPENPAANTELGRASFIFDVNLAQGSVTVKDPTLKLQPSLGGIGAGGTGGGPAYSILSNDAIIVTATNFVASTVGQVVPNKVRVTFDVAISNKLPNIDLITPSFPLAPAGQTGLLLLPYTTSIISTSGGGGTGGGNTVIFERPSNGTVTPNIHWNGNSSNDKPLNILQNPGPGGAPHNFFNDASCSVGGSDELPSDCYRYETFGIVGASLTATRRVGFDVDAGVGEFRIRMIAAADLNPRGTGTTGTVTGTVSSPARGPLAGVTVSLSGALVNPALTTVTDGSGAFTISSAPLGTHDLQLSALPSGCSAGFGWPAVTVVGGQTATQNFSVECSALLGTVSGTVTRTGPGTQDLSGVSFTIDPDAAGSPTVGGTISTGLSYSGLVEIGVGAGSGAGTVTLGNLPALCTAPAPGSYSGLLAGGSQAVNFTIDCQTPPAATRYQYSSTWGTPSGGFVNLLIAFDPSGFNSPAVNGAGPDGFAGIQAITTLTGTAASRLTAVTPIATGVFSAPTIGGTLPTVAWLANTAIADQFGLTGVATLQFLIGSGPAGTVTTQTTVQEISALNADPFPLVFSGAGQNIDVTEATLNLP
jgi:hypothetical protein